MGQGPIDGVTRARLSDPRPPVSRLATGINAVVNAGVNAGVRLRQCARLIETEADFGAYSGPSRTTRVSQPTGHHGLARFLYSKHNDYCAVIVRYRSAVAAQLTV